MRGQRADESELADFVAARTAELHRAAYLLTADQDRAERLVEAAVDRLRRDRTPLGQAGTVARHHMARLAAAATEPGEVVDNEASSPTDERRAAIAGMSPRQRAVLMLRCLDRFDERSTARELGISSSAAAAAESEATSALGMATDSDLCRTALTDFAEQATWPDAVVTVAAAAQVTPPRRRSRRRYVAAAIVLVVGAAAAIASQAQHDRWLRTPAGINATHGTHFHAYTQGFKLIGVQRVPVGTTRALVTSDGEAIALGCEHLSFKNQSALPRVTWGGESQVYGCAKQTADRYFLFLPNYGSSVTAPKDGDNEITVARYEPVPWDRYPVAQDHFKVEHDIPLNRNARMNYADPPVRAGKTVTIRGTNGTFTGTVKIPAPAKNTELFMSGLLSPTTTGQYKIEVDGSAVSDCAIIGTTSDTQGGWCRLHDRYVPQVPLSNLWGVGDPGDAAGKGSAKVKVDVRDALGPWKLEIRYDRYPARQ